MQLDSGAHGTPKMNSWTLFVRLHNQQRKRRGAFSDHHSFSKGKIIVETRIIELKTYLSIFLVFGLISTVLLIITGLIPLPISVAFSAVIETTTTVTTAITTVGVEYFLTVVAQYFATGKIQTR